MSDVDELLARRAEGIRQHLREYIETDGAKGYLRDQTHAGGPKVALALVLKTVGRRTGREILVPLTYAPWGDEYVIVASKGGTDEHPSWYLNLIARPEIDFQVKDKRFRGVWREAEGEERAVLWEYLTQYIRDYAVYQSRTSRRIPVLVLTARERIGERWVLPEHQR